MVYQSDFVAKKTRLATDDEVKNLIHFICIENFNACRKLLIDKEDIDVLADSNEISQDLTSYLFQNGTNEDVLVVEIEGSNISIFSFIILRPPDVDNDIVHYSCRFAFDKTTNKFEDISLDDYVSVF